MIRVFASRHRDHYRLLVEGHAKGHPDAALVCAATSALTQALVELVQKSEACHHVRCCVESGRVFLILFHLTVLRDLSCGSGLFPF